MIGYSRDHSRIICFPWEYSVLCKSGHHSAASDCNTGAFCLEWLTPLD
jgi:hypothetical protein